MKELIEFELESGGSIIVEVDKPEQGGKMVRVGRLDEIAETAKQSFERAMDNVKPIANTIISRLYHGLTEPADEISVEFGMKMNATFGAIVADAGAEAQFNITLTWKRQG